MNRFLDCGRLERTGGDGLELPEVLTWPGGVIARNYVLNRFYVKNGMINFPVVIKEAKKDFMCSYNNLRSLEGCPEIVGGSFFCFGNSLTTLKGCPKKVGYRFDCSDNHLTSLEGCPKEITENFICSENPGLFTEEDVRAVCKVGGKIIT